VPFPGGAPAIVGFFGAKLAEEAMQQVRILAIALLVATSSAVSQAQTKASCAFNFFQLSSDQRNGVTDKGTVVGQANSERFIRYSDGTIA
jgi:hypothetical protein